MAPSVPTHDDIVLGLPPQGGPPTSSGMDKGGTRGSSCHQCKNVRPASKLTVCLKTFARRSKPGQRRCQKKYCDYCCLKFYNCDPPDSRSWVCPSCRGVCSCALCTRAHTAPSKRNGNSAESPASASASASPPDQSHTVARQQELIAQQQELIAELQRQNQLLTRHLHMLESKASSAPLGMHGQSAGAGAGAGAGGGAPLLPPPSAAAAAASTSQAGLFSMPSLAHSSAAAAGAAGAGGLGLSAMGMGGVKLEPGLQQQQQQQRNGSNGAQQPPLYPQQQQQQAFPFPFTNPMSMPMPMPSSERLNSSSPDLKPGMLMQDAALPPFQPAQSPLFQYGSRGSLTSPLRSPRAAFGPPDLLVPSRFQSPVMPLTIGSDRLKQSSSFSADGPSVGLGLDSWLPGVGAGLLGKLRLQDDAARPAI